MDVDTFIKVFFVGLVVWIFYAKWYYKRAFQKRKARVEAREEKQGEE